MCVADSFLNPVIEVIAIRRTGLRFYFDTGKKVAVRDCKKIPPLSGSEIARQIGINLTGVDFGSLDAA